MIRKMILWGFVICKKSFETSSSIMNKGFWYVVYEISLS